MSSDRIERKRRSDFDTSDNSADELPAVKIRRLDPKISLRRKVSEACKNLLNWITPEFVKKMAVRVSHPRSSSSLRMEESNYKNQHLIDVDDNNSEEECMIVSVQNGTGVRSKSTPESSRKGSLSKSTRSSSNSSLCPLASTPQFPLSPENRYYKKATQTMERRKVNGFPVRAETGREDIRRSKQIENCIAPITKPRTVIDILLEKDIEIIKEVYPAKHSSGPSRNVKLGDARSSRSGSQSDFPSYNTRFSSFSKSYTANEVVRLQEKAQYNQLLNKVVNQAPLFQPLIPKESSQASITQDLTEDMPSSYLFKKEKVGENVTDFLKKYYKPCNLSSQTAKIECHTPSTPEKETIKDIGDSDIEIIEYPDHPKLRPRRKLSSILFSNEWLEEMKQSVTTSTVTTLQSVTENEKKILRFKKRREARNAEETKKREEMRLAGFIFPEDVEMEEETLPEITPEMEAIIEMALAPAGKPDDIISELHTKRDTNEVSKCDIATLTNLNWLNDQVINFYLGLIETRGMLDGYPSSICFNSFFYPKLKKEGPSKLLLRWTRKCDIFAADLIFVPLHLEMHWALLVVDNRSKTMKYYDSMGCREPQSLKYIEHYLITEMRDKKKAVLEPNTYKFEIPADIPKQMNGSDCGMFTLKYAEYLSRDAPLTFTQENMPYFRRRMIYELMAKQIL